MNTVFLSCRFEAQRKGAYNDYIYNFFKCLSPERIQYAEGYYSQQSKVDQFWEAEGYRIQRRCPHLKADLTRFARIEDGVLTCTMHGWQFDLATGRCLTSDDRRIYAQPLAKTEDTPPGENASNGSAPVEASAEPVGASPVASVATTASASTMQAARVANDQPHEVIMPKKCGHCWYAPSDLPPMRGEHQRGTQGTGPVAPHDGKPNTPK